MLSIPSKAFILGEYAVLRGAPALVATFAPRFRLLKNSHDGVPLSSLPEASPVRQLIFASGALGASSADHRELLDSRYLDPHHGAGGFGGSTAEFALAFAALYGADSSVTRVWEDYAKLQPQASGADLAAQWSGGIVIADPRTRTVEKISAPRIFNNFFVFSAAHQSGRKVKTHEHLGKLQQVNLEQLATSDVLARGLEAARLDGFETFARCVNEYGDLLERLGLQLRQTGEDRVALRDVSGVCAVKGTGAMQADALVVFGDPDQPNVREKLLSVARERDLNLVFESGGSWSSENPEAGITS